MKYKVRVLLRDRATLYTEVESDQTRSEFESSLGGRMVSGGFVVCQDSKWNRERSLVINALDVVAFELIEQNEQTI